MVNSDWFARLSGGVEVMRVLRGGGLYPASAALVLFGCFLITLSAYGSGSELLEGALSTIATLQFYEVLLIVSAIAIARTLRRLDDAGLLYAILVILLLDPALQFTYLAAANAQLGFLVGTFFAVLAPVKLHILGSALHLRIPTRGITAFALAAFFVQALAGPCLSSLGQPDARALPFYLLVCIAAGIAHLAPRPAAAFARDSQARKFATDGQRHALRRVAAWTPGALVLVHLPAAAWLFDVPPVPRTLHRSSLPPRICSTAARGARRSSRLPRSSSVPSRSLARSFPRCPARRIRCSS